LLLPLLPEQFGAVDQVEYPLEPGLLPMSSPPVDVVGTEEPLQ
jgi:hypothetical protein